MSLDVATIGIQLDTRSVLEGERAAVASFREIATAAEAMKKKTDEAAAATARIEQAQREQVAVQREVSAAIAEGRRRAQEYQVTEENRAANEAKYEAQRQQRLASERALAGNITQRAAAERVATEAMVAEAAAAKVLATTTEGVAVAGVKGVTGVRTLATAFSTLAASSVGLRGGLGSLVSTLGLMGPGAAVTIGVTAGIALIAAAYEALTGPARRAKEETDKLIDSLQKAAKARLGLDVIENKATLSAALAGTNAKLAALQSAPDRVDAKTGLSTSGLNPAAIAQAKAELSKLSLAIVELNAKASDKAIEAIEKEKNAREQAGRAAESAANRAAAAAKARLADERVLQQVALELAVQEAVKAKDSLAYYNAKRGLAELALQKELDGLQTLTAAEKRAHEERLRRLDELGLSGGGSGRFNDILKNGFGLTPTVGYSEQAQRNTVRFDAIRRVNGQALLKPEAVEAAGKAVEDRLSVAYKEAARNLQRGLTSAFEGLLTGAPDIGRQLGRAISSGAAGILAASLTDSVRKAFKNLPPETQERLKGIAGVAGAGAVGASVGYSTGSTGLGALSGAAAGSAFGAPGIIVGAVAGLVGGLLGSAKQAREAAARMEEARKAFGVSLKSFADEAYGTATTLSRAIASAQKAGDDLKKQAPAPVLGGVTSADRQRFGKDLADYIASLGKVDAATAAYIERLKDEEQVRLELIDLSLTEREAKIAGNDEGALRARAAREEAEVARQLRNGEITQAIADRTTNVIRGELTQSIEGLGDAAREASRALTESLVTRGLQARLRLAGSDQEREAIEGQIRAEEKRIERERAVTDKVDATTLALLDYTQGLEDQAIATERAANASKKAADAAYAQARATEDLTIRSLRATGQGGAAEVGAQIFQQQEEKRRAIEEGRSTEYLKTLDRVQAEERAASDKARRDAQDQAFAAGLGTDGTSAAPDSRTSVNLAVGASEGQVAQMTGILTSSLLYQASLPRIEAQLAVLNARVATWAPATVDDVDLGLALAAADANTIAGFPPGNR